jgi:DNA-directed RNA polymerase specialized sigma24 family protein
MNPFKRLFARPGKNKKKAMEVVPLEWQEIGDITEKLIARLEKKIQTLKALEAQADEKIAVLTNLLQKEKTAVKVEGAGKDTSRPGRSEVENLAGKGFKSEEIARILDLPSGEVELILNLVH